MLLRLAIAAFVTIAFSTSIFTQTKGTAAAPIGDQTPAKSLTAKQLAAKYKVPRITESNVLEYMDQVDKDCSPGGDPWRGIAFSNAMIASDATFGSRFERRAMCYEAANQLDLALADYNTLLTTLQRSQWTTFRNVAEWYKLRGRLHRLMGRAELADSDEAASKEMDKQWYEYVDGQRREPKLPFLVRASHVNPASSTSPSTRSSLSKPPVARSNVVDKSKPNDPDIGSGPYAPGTDLDKVYDGVIQKCSANEFRTGIAIANRLLLYATPDPAKNEPWNYQSWLPYKGRGHCKQMMNDYAGAFEDFNTLINLTPDFAMGYALRGEMHLKLGRRAEALADRNKCQELGGMDGCSIVEDEP